MGKKDSLGLVRGDLWYADPEEIVLVGIDTDDGDEHVLVADAVNREPLTDLEIRNTMRFGVIEPIWVRKVKTDEGTILECIAGRTRVRRARAANKRLLEEGRQSIRVPCLIKSLEEKVLAGVMVSENEMRRSTSQLEKARSLQRAYLRGITREEAVEIYGVVPESIERWEQLLSLEPSIVTRIETGEINATTALVVASLPQERQVAALDAAIKETLATAGKITGAKVKRKLKEQQRIGDGHRMPTPREMRFWLRLDETEKILAPEVSMVLRWLVYGEGIERLSGLPKILEIAKDGPKRGRPKKVVETAPPPKAAKPSKRKPKKVDPAPKKGRSAPTGPKKTPGVSVRKQRQKPLVHPESPLASTEGEQVSLF